MTSQGPSTYMILGLLKCVLKMIYLNSQPQLERCSLTMSKYNAFLAYENENLKYLIGK